MKFTGFEIKNYRSIGSTPLTFSPLKKCNILIGQNNIGKSNVLKALKLISDYFHPIPNNVVSLNHLDTHNRDANNPFTFKLFFETNNNSEIDKIVENAYEDNILWFEFVWHENARAPKIINHSLVDIKIEELANSVFHIFSGYVFNQTPNTEMIRNTFLKEEHKTRFFEKVKNLIPKVEIIPEFRRMRNGGQLGFDGQNLVETLKQYSSPEIGKDHLKLKFDKIEKLVQKLLNEPNAKIEITNPTVDIIINNGNIRLPVSSYGTGVHELIILISSIVIIENSICAIEEPEIHFHPRLQREFIDFLVNEADNQFLLSTHSPSIINSFLNSDLVKLFHIKRIDGLPNSMTITTDQDLLNTFGDLGIKPSDILQTNCIIWVEGSSDANYLKRWLELIAPTLIEGKHYIFIAYRNLYKLTADYNESDHRFTNILRVNRNAIVIVDSDKLSENGSVNEDKKRMIGEFESNNVKYWLTEYREIENYLSANVVLRAIKKIKNIDAAIEINPYDDFGETFNRAIISKGEKPIDYEKNKSPLSNLISSLYQREEITQILETKIFEIIDYIKEFNNL